MKFKNIYYNTLCSISVKPAVTHEHKLLSMTLIEVRNSEVVIKFKLGQ